MQKLVRDKVPARIRRNGERPVVEVLDQERYQTFLGLKLLEEVRELLDAADDGDPKALLAEIADVDEVLRTLARAHGFSRAAVRIARKDKARRRGTFGKRFLLVCVETRGADGCKHNHSADDAD